MFVPISFARLSLTTLGCLGREYQHFRSQIGLEEVWFSSMSIEQVESAIREMPPEERRRLLLWLDAHRYELFAGSEEVTEAQKTELLRRRQEYFDHPERFIRVTNEQELDRFFEDIRRDVQARLPRVPSPVPSVRPCQGQNGKGGRRIGHEHPAKGFAFVPAVFTVKVK